MHSQLGMAGQMKVRMAAGDAYQQPHSHAPPHIRTEMQQQLNSGAPMDDVKQIEADGTVTITNDSFRLCTTDECNFLIYCQLSQKNGSEVLLSYSSCSRYCQIALCTKVACELDVAHQQELRDSPGRFEVYLAMPPRYGN
jgi:hypothetical protein